MSLKRLLNNEDDGDDIHVQEELYARTPVNGFHNHESQVMDVPILHEAPSTSMNDVLGVLFDPSFSTGSPVSAMGSTDMPDEAYNLDLHLTEWAENMEFLPGLSPSTRDSTASLTSPTANSTPTSSGDRCSSAEEEEPWERCCFGMLHRVDVKLVGEMAVIDEKLDRDYRGAHVLYQQFTVTEQSDHILLSFKDDGTDFGYLRSHMNKALHGLFQKGTILLEAIAPTRTLRETIGRAKKASEAMVKVDINIYGPKDLGQMVGDTLSKWKLWLQEPDHPRAGSIYDNPHYLTLEGFEDLETEVEREVTRGGPARAPTRGEQLQHMMAEVYRSLGRGRQTHQVNGNSKITRNLLPHQKEALGFMLERESGEIQEEYRLWQPRMRDGQIWYDHKITKSCSRVRLEEKGGGILADEMGMGKSLSILALIVKTLEDGQAWAESERDKADTNKSLTYSRSTLVVVSSALLINNWANEIRLHLDGSMKVIKYHGQGREKVPGEIEDSDIVITTYNTLSAEHMAKSSILHQIGWYRVVLDEAHIIRRQATTFYKTCANLFANSRWCLTGTPIQNRLADIGALFSFIKARPFDDTRIFRRYIETPFEQPDEDNSEKVKERLVILLDSLCLRRTKDVLNLPKLNERIRELEFTSEERERYEKLHNVLKRTMKQRVGELEGSKFGLFQANMQLRIFCNHGTFQKDFSWLHRSLRDEREAAVSVFGQNAEITCSVCHQAMPILGSNKIYNSFVEVCSHVLCSECLDNSTFSTGGDEVQHCPVCSAQGKAMMSNGRRYPVLATASGDPDVVMSDISTEDTRAERDDKHYFRRDGHSTKIQALIRDVKEELHTTKSIIFSCWTRTLSLVARHLEDAGVPYLRIDGNCPLPQRQKRLDDFASDDSVRVLIMTTTTGAFGLNLTCANRVFIVELQWNPSVENQAIARAIRLGQRESVLVTRYIIKNSVEETMRSQQRFKLQIAEMGFG